MAIDKIRVEKEQNKDNAYIQVVGQFLLEHINTNPAAAELIGAEGKTIKGSLAAMRDEARKKQVDGCGVLTDAEGFATVLKYYGIEGAPVATPTPKPSAPKIDFEVSLDDLLPKY